MIFFCSVDNDKTFLFLLTKKEHTLENCITYRNEKINRKFIQLESLRKFVARRRTLYCFNGIIDYSYYFDFDITVYKFEIPNP